MDFGLVNDKLILKLKIKITLCHHFLFIIIIITGIFCSLLCKNMHGIVFFELMRLSKTEPVILFHPLDWYEATIL